MGQSLTIVKLVLHCKAAGKQDYKAKSFRLRGFFGRQMLKNEVDKVICPVLYFPQIEYWKQVMEVGCESHTRPLL